MYRKNTASQFIHFQGVDSTTGGIKSGVTWTIRRCIDGTFAAATGTVTEDSTNGWYKFAMSQADTNGNNIGFNFTGTGAIPQTVNIITTACDPTTATNFGITALPAVASGSAGAVLIDGTGTAAISNSSGKVLLQATQSGVTIPTVTTVTNQLTAAQVATGVWQDTTAGDFTTALSVGKSVMNGVSLGTGLTVNAVTGLTASNLDTTISSRMATFTLPTNFSSLAIDASGRVNAFLIGILTSVFTEGATGRIAAAFKQFFNIASPAATMDHGVLVDTVTTATTATNLTNAPTNGDLTATMKTSVTTACTASTPTAAAVTGAVGSVTGNVGGNVTGSVGSVAGNVTGSVGSVVGAVGSVTGNVGGNVTGSVGSVIAAVAITSNRKKASGATFEILMQDSTTGAPKTGLTVASVISKDGGAAASTSNSVTEIGVGQYQIVLTATEMTANNIFLQFTASGAVTYSLSIQTQP